MARVLEAHAVVSATDATGATFQRVAQKLRALKAAAQSVSGVSAPIAAFASKAEAASKKVTAIGRGLSMGVALPAAFAAKRGYDTVLAYEKELNKAQALGELTRDQANIIDRDARELGKNTQFTASQALEMMRTYIQAGRTFDQARGMTKPTLDFALFGDVDPKTAADTITAVASAYRLAMNDIESAAKSASQVGDVIAKAANISRADVRDLAQGFKYAAPMAKIAGMSMEELAAAIATMSNNGQRGDEAGVALRSMLVRMVAPTKKARAAMAELNLEFSQFAEQRPIDPDAMIKSLEQSGIAAKDQRDAIAKIVNDPKFANARGDMIPALTEALIKGSDLDTPQNREAIADAVGAYLLSNTERIDVQGLVKALIEKQASAGQLARIFDQRQGSRIATLLTPDFMKNVGLMQDASGASARGARIMEQGLYGAHKRFLSASENFILSLAKSGVIDTVSDTLNSLARGINALAETSPRTLEIATYATMATAALGPLAIVLGKLAGLAASIAKIPGVSLAAGSAAAGTVAGARNIAGAAPGAFMPWLGGAVSVATTPDIIGGAAFFEQLYGRYHRKDDGSLRGLSIDSVRSALTGGMGVVKAELEGSATVDVRVKVEPAEGFWAKVQSMASKAVGHLRINNGAPESGTSGSTGRTMPEAGAAP